MRKSPFITALAIGCLLSACCEQQDDIISENIENAKVQVGNLLARSEEGGTLRIPSTFKDGEVQFTSTDDWVSGFFAGTLWYLYELTGDETWAEKAKAHTDILESIQYLTWHHDVGFMVYDSFGNGLRLKGIESYKSVVENAAKSLSTRFRPAAGVLQSWNVDKGWQSQRGWTCPVIVDNLMNLELLFEATKLTGDSTYFNIAVSHADKTIENHFRPDNSSYHVVDYDPLTGDVLHRCTAQGYSDDSAWARGQAWGLYGYTIAYRCTGYERYLKQAQKIEGFIFGDENLPEDFVPYWDFDAPEIPDTFRDVSSAAIIASAMYELCELTGNAAYKAKADKIIESLSTPAYRAEAGTNGGFILLHSVGSIPHGSNIDVPLNYADYYFLEALVRKRRVESK